MYNKTKRNTQQDTQSNLISTSKTSCKRNKPSNTNQNKIHEIKKKLYGNLPTKYTSLISSISILAITACFIAALFEPIFYIVACCAFIICTSIIITSYKTYCLLLRNINEITYIDIKICNIKISSFCKAQVDNIAFQFNDKNIVIHYFLKSNKHISFNLKNCDTTYRSLIKEGCDDTTKLYLLLDITPCCFCDAKMFLPQQLYPYYVLYIINNDISCHGLREWLYCFETQYAEYIEGIEEIKSIAPDAYYSILKQAKELSLNYAQELNSLTSEEQNNQNICDKLEQKYVPFLQELNKQFFENEKFFIEQLNTSYQTIAQTFFNKNYELLSSLNKKL